MTKRQRSLLTDFPELIAQWHPELNGDLSPASLSRASGKRVWWRCPEGPDHEWEATVRSRATQGAGCPFCANQRVSITNSLTVLYPDVVSQWHATKNGEAKPGDFVSGSSRRVWWKCTAGPDHEWQAPIRSRTTDGQGCPFCSNHRVSVTNALTTTFPQIAAEWHPQRNGQLRASDVVARAQKNVWWQCRAAAHEWRASVVSRTKNESGCPLCRLERSTGTLDPDPAGRGWHRRPMLAEANPELVAQWHPTKNGDLSPSNVTAGSGRRVWWKCPEGPDHEWERTVNGRSRGAGCPYCGGRAVSITNCLETVNPEVALDWHPTKNGDLTPRDVRAASNESHWWKCVRGHEWTGPVHNRAINESQCPECFRMDRVYTGVQRAEGPISETHPELAAQWHPIENVLGPDEVTYGSGRRIWWKCPEGPDHEWETQVKNRTTHGHGCPFCASLRVSVTNSLATLFPEIAAQWHPSKNGDRTPADFTAHSRQAAWWTCPQGPDHEWEAVIGDRTEGNGCPCCANYKASVTNSIATQAPWLVPQWHPTRNELTPDAVVAHSTIRVWWKCLEVPEHEWEATVAARVIQRQGCPYCANYAVCDSNALSRRRPDIAAQWHPTRNAETTPDDVVVGSAAVVWWKCPEGPDHEWEQSIVTRTGGSGSCPFCTNRRVSVTNSLATKFPRLAAEWHATRNGDLLPSDIVWGSSAKVWWQCSADESHEWPTKIASRTRENTGCPDCHAARSSRSSDE